MKTKLLSLLLTVCILFTVLPLAVSADDGDITVTVKIRGDVVHDEGAHTEYTEWLNTTVTVESGTTADAALAAAAEGFTLTGIDTGYIYSVTNPDGITLTAGETNSALSGWMYDVNEISPMVGMSDYVLADGDVVNFFWVDDYNEVYGPSEITVTVNIRGDVVHEEGAHTEYTDWLNTTVTVESGTTADAALAAAAEGFTLTGFDTGYIYSVTNPDGITLTAGETNSALSGWMYDVNEISPMVGMSDYVLADGDVVNFFWVDDYNEVYGPIVPEMIFTDVLEGDWFYADVKELFEAGIIAGTSDTTFSPTETLSHGMLLTYLWRIAGSPAMENVGDEWYAAAVAWAAANGICGADIDAEALITREDIVTYLYRFSTVAADAVEETRTVSSARLLDVYQDGGSVSEYAAIPVAWALTNKIMRGAVGDNGALLINPTGNATRAEAIALLARLTK